jgi:hypothetical protein
VFVYVSIPLCVCVTHACVSMRVCVYMTYACISNHVFLSKLMFETKFHYRLHVSCELHLLMAS